MTISLSGLLFWATLYIISKSHDDGNVSARNTIRAPNNMQNLKLDKLKSLGKEKCFQLAFESVNSWDNSTKWWRQLVSQARSGDSERAVTKLWRGRWHCDRARSGGSETCSGGRCGRRRDEVGQVTWRFAVQATMNSHAQRVLTTLLDRKPMMIAKSVKLHLKDGRTDSVS